MPANPSPELRLAMAYFDAWTSKDVADGKITRSWLVFDRARSTPNARDVERERGAPDVSAQLGIQG